jgi:hypothetical protein
MSLAVDTTLLTGIAALVTAIAAAAVAIDALWRRQRTLHDVTDSVEKAVYLPAPPGPGVDSSFLLRPADKRPALDSLDQAIQHRGAKETGKLTRVRDELARSNVYALGTPAGDTSVPSRGTESDLLHFTVEDEDHVMLPVFTQPQILRSALERNPEWQKLSVLELNGGELLDAIDDDVTTVINPWSDLEFRIPPKHPKPSDATTTGGGRRVC